MRNLPEWLNTHWKCVISLILLIGISVTLWVCLSWKALWFFAPLVIVSFVCVIPQVRSWAEANWEYFLIIGLVLYGLGSLYYQATATWRNIVGTERTDFWVTDSAQSYTYRLAVRYPRLIPVKTVGERTQPLVIWFWKSATTTLISPLEVPECKNSASVAQTSELSPTWKILLYATSNQVVFTDDKGNETAGFLALNPSMVEAEAPRSLIYISRSFEDSDTLTPTMLCLQVWHSGNLEALYPVNGKDTMPIIGLETRQACCYHNLANLVLNTPTLTWVTFFTAAFGFWRKMQERRNFFLAQIQAWEQQCDTLPSQLWKNYWDLYQQIREFPKLNARLRAAWQALSVRHPDRPWQYEVKDWLTQQVQEWQKQQSFQYNDILKVLTMLKILDNSESVTLSNFFALSSSPKVNLEEWLSKSLGVFKILGVASTPILLTVLKKIIKDYDDQIVEEAIRRRWYMEGNAGRYLTHQAKADPHPLLSKLPLSDWEKERRNLIITKMRITCGPCALWQKFPEISPPHRAKLQELRLPSDPTSVVSDEQTPFGPLKAEQDPRLPALSGTSSEPHTFFWNGYDKGHPLLSWVDWIDNSHSCYFIAPHGIGRTAFIQMARHNRRLSGSDPALSLYLLLPQPVDKESLFQSMARALAESLSCALAEDPFWFLAAGSETQQQIAAFLLWWAKGHQILERRLKWRLRGIDGESPVEHDKAENELLFECLRHFAPATGILTYEDLVQVVDPARAAFERASRAILGEKSLPVFIWLDVQIEDQESLRALIQLLNTETSLHHIGYLKVFLLQPVPDLSETVKMEWSKDALREMVRYRLKQVGIDESSDFWQRQFDFSGTFEEALTWLVQVGDPLTPARVIERGNHLFCGEISMNKPGGRT